MKFLVDAQLPPGVCAGLAKRGFESLHVAQVLPGATPDRAVAAYAIDHQLILLTKDDDFARAFRDDGLQIVWLRIGNASNRTLTTWLDQRWEAIEAALQDGELLIEVR